MADVTYIPMYDEAGTVFVLGRVRPPDFSEFLRPADAGWQPDPGGIFIRRYYDSTDPWMPEPDARSLVESWGHTL